MNELFHHGVKGMKWGVRRYQNTDGTLTPEGLKRYRIDGPIGKKALSMNTDKDDKWKDERRRKWIRQMTGEEVESVTKIKKRSSPDEKTEFPKGHTVSHITTKDTDIKPEKGRVLFVAADEADKKLYSSVLAASIHKHLGGVKIKQVDFKLKQDLTAPSKREAIEIFKEQYKKHEKEYIDYFARTLSNFAKNPDFKDQFTKEERNPETFKKRFNENMKKQWLENDGYWLFNMGLTFQGNLGEKIYKGYLDEIKARGYNALVDDNDSRKSTMNGKVPIIILDELAMLGDMKVKDITNESVLQDYKEWVKMQKS